MNFGFQAEADEPGPVIFPSMLANIRAASVTHVLGAVAFVEDHAHPAILGNELDPTVLQCVENGAERRDVAANGPMASLHPLYGGEMNICSLGQLPGRPTQESPRRTKLHGFQHGVGLLHQIDAIQHYDC